MEKFCVQSKLCLSTTFYARHKTVYRATWYSNGERTQTHLIILRRVTFFKKITKDCKFPHHLDFLFFGNRRVTYAAQKESSNGLTKCRRLPPNLFEKKILTNFKKIRYVTYLFLDQGHLYFIYVCNVSIKFCFTRDESFSNIINPLNNRLK